MTAIEHQESSEDSTLRNVTSKIRSIMAKSLSAGDLASLRRLRPESPSCSAYWKLVTGELEASLPRHGKRREEAEERWAVVISAMAVMHSASTSGVSLGRALVEAGYSEQRLLQLLRARGDALARCVRSAATFLISKGQGLEPLGFAQLVLSDGGPNEELVRRGIARNYYRHI